MTDNPQNGKQDTASMINEVTAAIMDLWKDLDNEDKKENLIDCLWYSLEAPDFAVAIVNALNKVNLTLKIIELQELLEMYQSPDEYRDLEQIIEGLLEQMLLIQARKEAQA